MSKKSIQKIRAFAPPFLLKLLVLVWGIFCMGNLAAHAQERRSSLITEILHLGEKSSNPLDSDRTIFGEVNDIGFDLLTGGFIVVDHEMKNVRAFEINGNLKWKISQTGQGPGELVRPWVIDNVNKLMYLFDIGKRKIMIFNNSARFEREFPLPYYIHDMCVADNGNIYVSGVQVGIPAISARHLIHVFDQTGNKKKSFGEEIKFEPSDVTNPDSKMVIYQAYAKQIYLHFFDNTLLASPVFDYRTFVYTLSGELLNSFKNPNYKYKLLNYEAREGGAASFSIFETQSGPTIAIGKNYIIKSYQVSPKDKRLDYFLDIFDKNGNILHGQIPINGLVMEASNEGLLYASCYHPFPQIWVYRLDMNLLRK